MREADLSVLALGGMVAWWILSRARPAVAAAPSPLGTWASVLLHPADAYAGTWTAIGPLVPSSYDKQIWD